MLISFLALADPRPDRRFLISHWGVYPVQILDGVGAGLQSVAVPGLVARILNGTGRINVGQGAVMTVQGLGASLSPAIGGWIAQEHRLQRHVHDPGQFRSRLDRALGRLCVDPQTCLRGNASAECLDSAAGRSCRVTAIGAAN